MAQDPKILMLDEPCANLDIRWRQEISELLEELHGRTKTTVLMVSHETNVLPPACKRVLILADGRLVSDGNAETVLAYNSACR